MHSYHVLPFGDNELVFIRFSLIERLWCCESEFLQYLPHQRLRLVRQSPRLSHLKAFYRLTTYAFVHDLFIFFQTYINAFIPSEALLRY